MHKPSCFPNARPRLYQMVTIRLVGTVNIQTMFSLLNRGQSPPTVWTISTSQGQRITAMLIGLMHPLILCLWTIWNTYGKFWATTFPSVVKRRGKQVPISLSIAYQFYIRTWILDVRPVFRAPKVHAGISSRWISIGESRREETKHQPLVGENGRMATIQRAPCRRIASIVLRRMAAKESQLYLTIIHRSHSLRKSTNMPK